jgi:serine/threonine-protein kinase
MKGGGVVEQERFGRYRLDALIGQGGMGEVYRAYDTDKERIVAVKRLPPQLAGDTAFQDRFRRESKIAASLREPHIIPIHDYGEIDGRLFIDMRLVEGIDLGAVIAQYGPLHPVRAVDIISQIAGALDAAHADGLIHRDIKPSNVLLSGGGPGGDYIYLIDFGIAHSSASTGITATGATVGTLDYLAPERILGQDYDHRVDIYSLGALLYSTLTGCSPFPGEGPAQMYAHIHTPPPGPSARRPDVPVGLDTVVVRAMAKDPEDRYGSAAELAHAARAALNTPTRTATARPTNPGISAPPTLVSTSTPSLDRPRANPPTTARSTHPEVIPASVVTKKVVVLAIVAVLALAAVGIALLTTVRPNPTAATTNPTVTATIPKVTATIPVYTHPDGIAVSPDGQHVYTANGDANSVSVIDAAGNTVTATIPVGTTPAGVAVSPDGRHLYTTNLGSNSVWVIDMASNTATTTIPVGAGPVGVAMSPDGRRIYTANSGSDSVSVIDTGSNSVAATIPVGGFPTGVAVSPDGRHVYIANQGSDSVSVIDAAGNTVTATISVGTHPFWVAVSPDGHHVYATNNRSNSVSVIDTGTG